MNLTLETIAAAPRWNCNACGDWIADRAEGVVLATEFAGRLPKVQIIHQKCDAEFLSGNPGREVLRIPLSAISNDKRLIEFLATSRVDQRALNAAYTAIGSVEWLESLLRLEVSGFEESRVRLTKSLEVLDDRAFDLTIGDLFAPRKEVILQWETAD